MNKKVLLFAGAGLILLVIAYLIYKHEARKAAELEEIEEIDEEPEADEEPETEQPAGTDTGTEQK